ncbi:MAG: response regulator [Polyangiaceae bacterium]|nr:response regulator [Polyangiaceae bacterium]
MHVLIVDDSAAVRDRLARELGELPNVSSVTQVGDLAAARRELATSTPDLIVLDLHLPDGLGLELLPTASAVAMISTDGSVEHRVGARRRGAQWFFEKPGGLAALIEMARAWPP